jgi:hypothetical protein
VDGIRGCVTSNKNLAAYRKHYGLEVDTDVLSQRIATGAVDRAPLLRLQVVSQVSGPAMPLTGTWVFQHQKHACHSPL